MLFASRVLAGLPDPPAAAFGREARRDPQRVRLRLRLRVWIRALELDRCLADGRRPAGSPELALRAESLRVPRSRAALSTGLIAAVDAASRAPATSAAAPLAARNVLEAAGPLIGLARDLALLKRPAVRGIALASWLVCDSTRSPLYDERSPLSARDIAQQARSLLAEAEGPGR
jgi:hypothetical protein